MYGDYTVNPATGQVQVRASYLPGIGQWSAADPDAILAYYHGDQIGTLRATSELTGDPPQTTIRRLVHTAFGEPISADPDTNTRYGYAGPWGYETIASLPWQHVRHRYYDPGIGRFLQRDPMGIDGGLNLYAYVSGRPTIAIDPLGLTEPPGRIAAHAGGAVVGGGIAAAAGVGICVLLSIPTGGAAGIIIIGAIAAGGGAVGYDVGGSIYDDCTAPPPQPPQRTWTNDDVEYLRRTNRGFRTILEHLEGQEQRGRVTTNRPGSLP